jgi:hypothetical protein
MVDDASRERDWTIEGLLNNFGHMDTKAFRYPYAEEGKAVKLAEFIRSMPKSLQDEMKKAIPIPPYIFEKNVQQSRMLDWMVIPSELAVVATESISNLEHTQEFILGPAYSSSHPHDHGDAFSFVTNEGCLKKWFLDSYTDERSMCAFNNHYIGAGYPYGQYMTAKSPLRGTLQFIRERFAEWRLQEESYHCTLRKGEIFYIPKYWCHAVVNLNDCASYTVAVMDNEEDSRRKHERAELMADAGVEVTFTCDEIADIIFINPETGAAQLIGRTERPARGVIYTNILKMFPDHRVFMKTLSDSRDSVVHTIGHSSSKKQHFNCRNYPKAGTNGAEAEEQATQADPAQKGTDWALQRPPDL